MNDKLKKIYNKQFKNVYIALYNQERVKDKTEFGNKLGTYNHIINAIFQGKRSVTFDQLGQLIRKYNVNANYLFGRSNMMFANCCSCGAFEIKKDGQ